MTTVDGVAVVAIRRKSTILPSPPATLSTRKASVMARRAPHRRKAPASGRAAERRATRPDQGGHQVAIRRDIA
jgi:hypothetical protein